MEAMTEHDLELSEKRNTGTAITRNKFLEENGYLILENLCDPDFLSCPVPEERGQLTYFNNSADCFQYVPIEHQVEGSIARYWHPQYRQIHSQIKIKLEKELGKRLYNTYYYDRFYFPGQELKKHTDRDACEISVTVHVSTNLKGKQSEWPIWIKTPDIYKTEQRKEILKHGEDRKVILKPGDGMVYKGCERPHWREPMPVPRVNKNIIKNLPEGYYYHQIFFHYVLQDGHRAHCAFDAAR